MNTDKIKDQIKKELESMTEEESMMLFGFSKKDVLSLYNNGEGLNYTL